MEFTIRDIVIKYLQENGYDGLVSNDGDCGCRLDDLFPCTDYCLNCIPGYLVKCEHDECHWHMAPTRSVEECDGEHNTED